MELGANYVPNEPKKASAYVPPSLRARGSIVGLEPEAGASVHFAAQALKHSSGSVGSRAHYIPGLTLDEDGKKKPKQRKKKPKTEGDAAVSPLYSVDKLVCCGIVSPVYGSLYVSMTAYLFITAVYLRGDQERFRNMMGLHLYGAFTEPRKAPSQTFSLIANLTIAI